ncbi:MAG: diadenylate cyclase [Acholeplasmataceae bacterium]|jgi:diadenylate cyclase
MINGHPIWKIIVVAYVLLVLIYSFLRLMFTNRKTFTVFLAGLLFMGVSAIFYFFIISDELKVLKDIIVNINVIALPIMVTIVVAPDIRNKYDADWIQDGTKISGMRVSSEQTKEHIIDAVIDLSNRKIGAIITMENHNTLDQYAEKAILINGKVTKELLLNIFTPLTPLHDGAVIIRGDEVVCAAAYFILSRNDTFDKTMGSRHRAALGISEITDSLTIVVSEETGDISIAVSSMLIKLNSREKLLEYLNLYIK